MNEEKILVGSKAVNKQEFFRGKSIETIHREIASIKPKPPTCPRCGWIPPTSGKKTLHLSYNLHKKPSKEDYYSENPADYAWLCPKCHLEKDAHIRTRKRRMDMVNQRIKNLDMTLRIVDEHNWAQLPTMQAILSLELGVTEKKAFEYLKLLAFHKKIILENGWVLSILYSGPKPWTDEFSKLQQKKSAEPIELTEEEKAILGD